MPNQKRRSQLSKKQVTEKQLLLNQRSRSIKASLLKVLSLDVAALYQSNSRHQGNPPEFREVNRIVRDTSTIEPASPSAEEEHEKPYRSLPSERIEERSSNSTQQQQNLSQQIDDTQQELTVVLLIFRLLAFFTGLLVHHVIQLYFSTQSFALLGIAIAIGSISVLAVVILMPWNRKLLWNLCSLFGGLLFAVIAL